MVKKIGEGVPRITKNGNLELSKYIGIQRKGSGKNINHKNSIQFKDRGYLNIFKDTYIEKMKLRGLSLFSCSGIAEYYIKNNDKIDMVLANELLEDRARIYKHFYPECEVIQGDIIKQYDNILEMAKRENIDFIMATPPCQSFSNAGRKDIGDSRTPLFMYIIKLIKELNPKYVLIENVPNFMKSKYKKNSSEIISQVFERKLTDYIISTKILNTKDYEIPQSRQRSITLLTLKGLEEWKHPKKSKKIVTVRDAIGHLPSLNNEEKSDVHKWHYCRKHNSSHILWMSHTPTGKTAFDNEIHFPSKNGRRIKGYKTTYKRIEWEKPSPTITMSSGSISSQNNVHPGNRYTKFNEDCQEDEVLYDNPRALSVYEIMLLTGLDDNWDPPTSNEKLVRDIIGEAIPPKLVKAIIDNLPL
jgi:DNA (cytosine-5)-methyltransferase 1